MAKISRRHKAGLPPGALISVASEGATKVTITVMDYTEGELREQELENLEDCCLYKDTQTTTWIDVDGVHDVKILEKVADCYGLHPLVLEDIVTTDQRAKIEDYETYLFLVLKIMSYDEESRKLESEQMSLILGPNYVLSFQEKKTPVLEPVRDRIRKGSRIRKRGPDYLAYALMDAVVDGYFVLLEKIGEDIEEIEDELLADPDPATLETLQELKRSMITLRRSIWPLREVIGKLEREEPDMIQDATKIYLRDLYDHTVQVMDTIETYRDILAGMLDIYLSSVSNRMNEVMKVLTVIATIFIPLTFVAGVYGMNFNPAVSPLSMPELNWEWGYVSVWAVMLLIAGGMAAYFRRRGWL